MKPKNSARMNQLLDELADEIERASTTGETDVRSMTILMLRSGNYSSVTGGGCTCCNCMAATAALAKVHAEKIQAECQDCNKPELVH